MLWDTHMHTGFSTDSEAAPESMAEAALARGLSGICFTDHQDYDYPGEPGDFQLDVPSYLKAMWKLRQQYEDRLPIRIGIELGLQPQAADRCRELLTKYTFDFVIGSSHVVHGYDPYYDGYYEGKTEKAAYREYFESILENLESFSDFDVYGHLDYVVRYGPNQNRDYSYRDYADVLDEVLRKLIDMGKGIELNTGGFRAGLGHPNPTEEILKRYRELGGEIITIGADGHKPADIAWDFDKVPGILRSAGFSYYTVFHGRRAEFLPVLQ